MGGSRAPTIVARKEKKPYSEPVLDVRVKHHHQPGAGPLPRCRRRREARRQKVVVVDDVISSSGTLLALESSLTAGAELTGVMAPSPVAKSHVIALGHLPLF